VQHSMAPMAGPTLVKPAAAPPSGRVRLRVWQKAALEKFEASPSPDFLAVATPGAGKTTFALVAALHSMAANPKQRLVVVAPTAHLKTQWADAAARFGLHIDPQWSQTAGQLPPDMHGIVTTYQQVATSAAALKIASAGAFVILDEIHHAGDERAWGDSVRKGFDGAARRLSLSGTPFRSDTRPIPFLRYTLEEAVPDYEYGYAEALRDGSVVRPAYFPRINGFMEWMAPDGSMNAASFDDPLERTRAAQRLRTALSPDGEWMPDVLRQAHEQLLVLRQRNPKAGGLVIATDQDHARSIANLMRTRLRVTPVVVLSDDPEASGKIAAFAKTEDPWIVAVRMVSEGVDISRLQIGVFATTTSTELFFRQAVGRLVRWTSTPKGSGPRGRQKAFMFIPDDPRLRTYAHQIADSRKHSLRKRSEDAGDALDGPAFDDGSEFDKISDHLDQPEQLSLFTALSATVADGPHPIAGVFDDQFDEDERESELVDGDPGYGIDGADGLLLDVTTLVPPLPKQPANVGLSVPGFASMNRYEQKEALRVRNAELARDIARAAAMEHRVVNSQLNKAVGITRIGEATVEQLDRRAREAQRWYSRL
jgi:superfamily II DNA or RNA helicase